jgi:endonuclease/exonuclease/phosphatase (EEP) superfamily protein YafD
MQGILMGLALFFIIGTLLPLLSHDHWTVRFFDFPRMQIAAAGPVIAGVYVTFWDTGYVAQDAILIALMACVGYQLYTMHPYTPVASTQVMAADEDRTEAQFSVLIANVRVSNRDAQPLRELIDTHQPDLVLTLETDAWWETELEDLKQTHPHVVKHVLDNAYGMMLHARLPLINPEVRFLVDDDVPSIHTQVELPSGVHFDLHQMHPRPPHPMRKPNTTERDAELLILGQQLGAHDRPSVVAGDLNDVSWSYTTSLFQKTSGLLDPRIGRGMYNTFHAEYPFFRYPLDHTFHTKHFKLVDIQRLPYIGSDHFPVLVTLQYEDGAPTEQDSPDADPAEEAQAHEEIAKVNDPSVTNR